METHQEVTHAREQRAQAVQAPQHARTCLRQFRGLLGRGLAPHGSGDRGGSSRSRGDSRGSCGCRMGGALHGTVPSPAVVGQFASAGVIYTNDSPA